MNIKLGSAIIVLVAFLLLSSIFNLKNILEKKKNELIEFGKAQAAHDIAAVAISQGSVTFGVGDQQITLLLQK